MQSSQKSPSFFSFFFSLIFLFLLVFSFKSSILDANNIPSGSMIPSLKVGDYLFVNKMRYSLRLPFVSSELFHIDNPVRGDIITFQPLNNMNKHFVKRVLAMPNDRIRIRELYGCKFRKKNLPNQNFNFNCNNSKYRDSIREPLISFLEYKENNKGPWKNYPIEELTTKEIQNILADSDDILAFTSLEIKNENLPLPVLYREKIGNLEHLILETSELSRANGMCAEIYTTGCLVPKDSYFVMGDYRDNSEDSRIIGFIHRKNIFGKAFLSYFSINWRDEVCASYWRNFRSGNEKADPKIGLPLKHFSPEDQYKYCTDYDLYLRTNWPRLTPAFIASYIYYTALYRIPRMSIRWNRIARPLH